MKGGFNNEARWVEVACRASCCVNCVGLGFSVR
jgi:hypothetical protein